MQDPACTSVGVPDGPVRDTTHKNIKKILQHVEHATPGSKLGSAVGAIEWDKVIVFSTPTWSQVS